MTSEAASIAASRSADLRERGDRHNSPSYRPSLVIDRGEGVTLWDVDGNEYLDFVAGIAVCSLGYGHPRLVEALTAQIDRGVVHTSNMFYTEPQIRLMERLTAASFADRVFLCNSGTEATEAGMKLARRYQRVVRGDEKRDQFISMKKSFHGRTLASITATGQPKYHKGFEPLPPGYHYAEFNDLASVEALISERTTGVIVEPVQGEGGVRPSDPAFLQGLRDLCDEHGAVLIYDEVQTGMGRTGDLFAYQGYDIAPDIICLAKGLGSGVPVGAMMATEEVFQGFEPGSHASTFGGNPLASTAANTVLDVIEEEDLLSNVRSRGAELVEGLTELGERFETIVDVRGRGLMVGVECVGEEAKQVATACRAEGLLVNTAGGTTVRFVPPLIVEAQHVEEALRRFERAVSAVARG